MEEYRVIVTPRAASDLERIRDYIATDSLQNAAAMIDRILDALEPLKQFPHRTIVQQENSKLRHPVRSIVVQPYIVYFRVLDEQRIVRVLHVRHGARKQLRRFRR